MTFRLQRAQFTFRASRTLVFPTPASNSLRGAIGKRLWQREDGTYEAFFAPRATTGPSGLADPPRPFVLRAHMLDGLTIDAGAEFQFDLHVFDGRRAWLQVLEDTLGEMGDSALVRVAQETILVPFARRAPAQHVEIAFVTPTELKTEGGLAAYPEFGILAARARDRISTLLSMYGEGPLDLDFRAFGERAAAVKMTASDIHHVEANRRSGRTGQMHPLGGFVGSAHYEGSLDEFLPLLEAAAWTGVGRQTTWGKGAILVKK